VVVGSPAQVADELQAWMDGTDIDGFNLAYVVTPETFSDFVELVVPELQRRGVYKSEYRPGSIREKLFGPGRARLSDDHPGAKFRYRPSDEISDAVPAESLASGKSAERAV